MTIPKETADRFEALALGYLTSALPDFPVFSVKNLAQIPGDQKSYIAVIDTGKGRGIRLSFGEAFCAIVCGRQAYEIMRETTTGNMLCARIHSRLPVRDIDMEHATGREWDEGRSIAAVEDAVFLSALADSLPLARLTWKPHAVSLDIDGNGGAVFRAAVTDPAAPARNVLKTVNAASPRDALEHFFSTVSNRDERMDEMVSISLELEEAAGTSPSSTPGL